MLGRALTPWAAEPMPGDCPFSWKIRSLDAAKLASSLDVTLVEVHFHGRHTLVKIEHCNQNAEAARIQAVQRGFQKFCCHEKKTYSSSFRALFSWKVSTSVHLTWVFCLSAQYDTITRSKMILLGVTWSHT